MPQIQCLDSKIENATNILAKLCIEPLKKGQGITVGNALRRILLSDIPGIAIVGVRISDVNHEPHGRCEPRCVPIRIAFHWMFNASWLISIKYHISIHVPTRVHY